MCAQRCLVARIFLRLARFFFLCSYLTYILDLGDGSFGYIENFLQSVKLALDIEFTCNHGFVVIAALGLIVRPIWL